MKSILFIIAILFASVGHSQSKQDWVWYGTKSATLKVKGVDKNTGKPVKTLQTKRSDDTLTVIDKTIKFIVVDGVTYEIVRTTEIKKVEEGPIWRTYTFPQGDTTFYKGLKIGGNSIMLTPNFNPITTY